jgi:hypothetical protein
MTSSMPRPAKIWGSDRGKPIGYTPLHRHCQPVGEAREAVGFVNSVWASVVHSWSAYPQDRSGRPNHTDSPALCQERNTTIADDLSSGSRRATN